MREAVARRGLLELTEIQRLALPLLTTDSDALLVSPTGTGKTEAALLPLLSRRLKNPTPPISILYVTPLRALNRDLEHRLTELAREVGLELGVRHGDTPPAHRLRQSRHPPDLLVTTPETLQLLLVGPRLRQALAHVRAVIVDEVHELVASDRGAQLGLTLERLDRLAQRRVRRIGLSATVGNPDEVARFLAPAPRDVLVRAAEGRRELELVARRPEVTGPPLPPELVRELKAEPRLLDALRSLLDQIRAHRSTLVFVNTRRTAEGIAARLQRLAPDLAIAVHHGSLSREIREEAEVAFREGKLKALVATSSLELGIDIGWVDHVAQFGSPHQVGRLVQRIGRSGHRLGRTIHGAVLALDDDDLEEAAVLARRADEGLVEPLTWRTRNRLAAGQQIVAELRAEGTTERNLLIGHLRGAAAVSGLDDGAWNELLDYLVELSLARTDQGRIGPGRATLARFYASLSLIPDERTYRLRDIATRRLIGTLDERFVLTQILAQPEEIFLLHGRTWKVVEYREGELLVEGVQELGVEPRWAGEDLPVPFEVAQEIGAMRRSGSARGYPVPAPDARGLEDRWRGARAAESLPTDETITVTSHGRVVVYGACFGTRTNETLAVAASGLLTARLGAAVEIAAVEPTWFVLELPIALDPDGLRDALAIDPDTLPSLLERLVPLGLDYRWVFLTVARKWGVVSPQADPRDLRSLDALIEANRRTPLGEEALDKTLHERYDLAHAGEVLERIRSGRIAIVPTPPGPFSSGPIERLRWRAVPDVPPPTLIAAIRERLEKEPLALVCLRCGFARTTTAARYRSERGSRCLLCRGALSAVLSPRREAEIDQLVRYARSKRRAPRTGGGRARGAGRGRPPDPALVRAGYTSAELLATHGERALLALAARGIGPETARRLLARPYRTEEAFLTELLRAERAYARTRAFWD